MPRTIVYPSAPESAPVGVANAAPPPPAPAPQITFGGRAQAKPSAAATNRKRAATADDYKDKIAKYVPAEVLAFFAPMAAAMTDRPNLLWAAAGVGLIATPGYLWQTARNLSAAEKPLPHFYVLAALSFAVWAVATTRLGQLVGLDSIAAAFLLGTTVFLLPLIDSILVRTQRRK